MDVIATLYIITEYPAVTGFGLDPFRHPFGGTIKYSNL